MQNRKKKDADLQNSLLDSVGEGEGGMFQENSIETCIVSRVKQCLFLIASVYEVNLDIQTCKQGSK